MPLGGIEPLPTCVRAGENVSKPQYANGVVLTSFGEEDSEHDKESGGKDDEKPENGSPS